MNRIVLATGVAAVLLTGFATLPSASAADPAADAAEALRQAAEAWAAAIAAKDPERIARAIADDAFVMYPQPAPTIGREANREAWARFFARPNAEHPVTVDTVVVSAAGDLAYTRGRYAGRYEGADGPVSSGGRYLAVWQRRDGEWQIVAFSANRHQPPPSMTPDAR
jgi:uncharacterized protein (TIGR02246 family)